MATSTSSGGSLLAADETHKPRTTLALLHRLWRDYLGAYGWLFLGSLIAMAVYAASSTAIPIGLEWIYSAFSGETDRFEATARDVVFWGPILVIGLAAVNAGALYIQTRLTVRASLSVLRDLQKQMYRRLMAADFAQLRIETSGQMVARFSNDPMVLRETLTRAARAVRDAFTFLGFCGVMLYYDWALFAVVILVYGVVVWPVSEIGRKLRKGSAKTQAQAGDVASFVNETVAGARLIKTYQLEGRQTAEADAVFNQRFSLLKKLGFIRAINEPLVFFVGAVAVGIVVAVAALRIMEGALNGPQFIAFIVALLMLSQPARGLSTLNAVMQEGFAALERMLMVIDIEPAIEDRPGAQDLQMREGAISFQNVSFSYRADVRALEGMSLDVPAGARIALVGESGAGKSTVFHLLPRLYEVDSGAIEIDGQNIADVTGQSLRRAISVVSQDAFLFDDDIRANIALGDPSASEAAIIDAAKAAAAHEFIITQPDGYNTRVGEGGAQLSGGQRQRIALARAFLKNAPILLLDEATAALDAESEAKVQNALQALTKGRTTLIIAHRLSTIHDADLIAVMDNGRVVEQGTHEALIAAKGAYARLNSLQLLGR